MTENIDQEHRIIEAAQRLFTQKGFAETSMSDIAAEAGMNRSALHYYFRTKDRMFQAVFGNIIMTVVPAVHDILVSDSPFEDKISRVVDTYMKIFSENPYLPSFILNETRRDREHLLSTARALGIAEYGNMIIHDISSEMEKGHLKTVPLKVVFNTFYGLLLYFGHSARHADADAGLLKCTSSQRLLYKILNHFLGHRIIRDNALTQRTYRHNIARRSPEHQARLLANGLYHICIPVKGNDRGLLEHNALAVNIYQYAGSPKINPDIY